MRVVSDPPCGHGDLVPYLSPMTADNALELHSLANPACGGANAFECGDHWHIGHPDRVDMVDCRAAAAVALEDRHNRRSPTKRPRRRRR